MFKPEFGRSFKHGSIGVMQSQALSWEMTPANISWRPAMVVSSRWPPRWGGCAKQKLCLQKSGRVGAGGELESDAQCGSAVKAVYFMERSCPMSSMAPVLAITKMVAASS